MPDDLAAAITAAQAADRKRHQTGSFVTWIKLEDERVRVMLEAAAPLIAAAAVAEYLAQRPVGACGCGEPLYAGKSHTHTQGIGYSTGSAL